MIGFARLDPSYTLHARHARIRGFPMVPPPAMMRLPEDAADDALQAKADSTAGHVRQANPGDPESQIHMGGQT
jgi:hypothetical protein